ncbi:ankyrin repeat protein [Emericellopsis atlantica]|uniref:Ankyrin repeat protein n=1 Tax=Emericellopsis atlantica TaxID=2614577 RepID=A0A9P8CT28_9HYPO|nr:ankyrin repeat protein [Emericellopsis atlantica]KAG9256396.1 ankyrin repeat protein [Emericellopsis atlantica]
MSLAAGRGGYGPMIADDEDPIMSNATSMRDDDLFDDLIDYSGASPDTLQRLDTARKDEGREAEFAYQKSPESPYHEYSDDSAGSLSRQEGKKTASREWSPQAMEEGDLAMLDFSTHAPLDDESGHAAIELPTSQPTSFEEIFRQHQDSDKMNGEHKTALSWMNETPTTTSNSGAAKAGHLSPPSGSCYRDVFDPDSRDSTPSSGISPIYNTPSPAGQPSEVKRSTSPNVSRQKSPNGQNFMPTEPTLLKQNSMARYPVPITEQVVMPPQFAQGMNGFGGPQQMQFPQLAMPAIPRAPMPTSRQPTQYQLIVPGSPRKSRVETQIPLKLVLVPAPPGVTKIHLPHAQIAKPKLQTRPAPAKNPNMLELTTSVVCTSAMRQKDLKEMAMARARTNGPDHLAPESEDNKNSAQQYGAEVRICENCMKREKKRAERKKVKNPEEEQAWLADQVHRVLVFNGHEVKDWEKTTHMDGFADALKLEVPIRIACYCRHHGEKMGFNIIFTLKDYQGNVVTQAMSDAIMITDDHKTIAAGSEPPQSEPSLGADGFYPLASAESLPTRTAPQPSMANGPPAPLNPLAVPAPAGSSSANRGPGKTSTQRPGRSRPASPVRDGPTAKKRKSSSSSGKIPKGLVMTPRHQHPQQPPPPTANGVQSQRSAPTSPFDPSLGNLPVQETAFPTVNNTSPPSMPQSQQEFGTFSPSSTETLAFGESHRSSMDSMARPPLYSAPQSHQPSRAPSPGSMMFNGLRAPHQNEFNQLMIENAFGVTTPRTRDNGAPVINKILPQEGPIEGGTEVTLLGSNFQNGMAVYFGTTPAVTTTWWGTSAVVCMTPATNNPGPVPVICQASPAHEQEWRNKVPPMFKYVDSSETQLMRLALQCIGGKMTGQECDPTHIARSILHQHTGPQGAGQSGGPSPSSGGAGNMYSRGVNDGDTEQQLLKCLDVIDLDDSPYSADFEIKTSSGQTMLHLACSRGYLRFTAALLARGANPNELDHGHCTPLFHASLRGRQEVVKRLLLAGAGPRVRNKGGLTPLEVAATDEIAEMMRFHGPVRSASGDFSHSRANSRASSVSSLRSLIEPMSRITSHARYSGEESPEYTTGDFEDEDPDENVYMDMRRPSLRKADLLNQVPRPDLRTDAEAAHPAPGTLADLKEQFQQQLNQLQQTMALHLQNLPHLPQMPHMPALPGMAGLPDYQAYFQQAPLMRRMTQYMPGRNGNRPESPDGSSSPKLDHKWWDLSALMNPSAAALPPPAYEEIFPVPNVDEKMAGAAGAAAEMEADEKCAALYDQPLSSSSAAAGVTTTVDDSIALEPTAAERAELPSVLKIGRKNDMTKEQQEHLLRAREEKLKRISADRNLFFIWIPLLVLAVCAMLYSSFPGLFGAVASLGMLGARKAAGATARLASSIRREDRVIET